jgi:hypothetical protein
VHAVSPAFRRDLPTEAVEDTMRGLTKGVALSVGLGVVIVTPPSWTVLDDTGVPAGTVLPFSAAPEDDPRVRAFVHAYGILIDSVTYGADDVVFHLRGRPVRFADGRMLGEGRSDGADRCDSIFYPYSLEPLTQPLDAPDEMPLYCTDVLESLWGRTESEVRRHGRSTTFLDHRMFVNEILVGPLASVEREILATAAVDDDVAAWVAELDITYSFISRDVAGSPTRSHHAWGMAVDLVPGSYEGRHVYWRWSRVSNREGWDRIPLEDRWSPPRAVVEVFERHGFVWGGKWAHFDVIHFEYRPEIILYNRLISGEA